MTFYLGQNQDPPDESTGTRPDESTTLDPAAFQSSSGGSSNGGSSTFYIGQNEDPPDESTGTRPDEAATLDPAAFQSSSGGSSGGSTGNGNGYFVSNYFPGSYFVSNYFPGATTSGGSSGGNTGGTLLTPILYPPYIAVFANGRPHMRFSLADGYAMVDAFLADTPGSGITNIDLTGATVNFSLRNVLSRTVLINNPAIIVSPQILETTGIPGTSVNLTSTTALNECIYVFSQADVALLIPGKYIGTFVVTFASGLTLSFGNLQIYVVPIDSW